MGWLPCALEMLGGSSESRASGVVRGWMGPGLRSGAFGVMHARLAAGANPCGAGGRGPAYGIALITRVLALFGVSDTVPHSV